MTLTIRIHYIVTQIIPLSTQRNDGVYLGWRRECFVGKSFVYDYIPLTRQSSLGSVHLLTNKIPPFVKLSRIASGIAPPPPPPVMSLTWVNRPVGQPLRSRIRPQLRSRLDGGGEFGVSSAVRPVVFGGLRIVAHFRDAASKPIHKIE